MEGSELDYYWLIFGWLNSDMVWLAKELPLTAMVSSGEIGQNGNEYKISSKDYLR